MYEISTFAPKYAPDLAKFLNRLRQDHWSLTSFAFERKPQSILPIKADDLIEQHQRFSRLKTLILFKNNQIISIARIDDKLCNGEIAVISGVDTLPQFQKKGVFWLTLGEKCIRDLCHQHYNRIEAETWSFNRKGIPLYKRVGFRAVPGTNLLMENYLPSIIKHPEAQPYFAKHDYIRTLQNKRSYGYDAIEIDGVSVFEYHWKTRKSDDELRVLVDWQNKEIVIVSCRIS